jgi:hypothetical protein
VAPQVQPNRPPGHFALVVVQEEREELAIANAGRGLVEGVDLRLEATNVLFFGLVFYTGQVHISEHAAFAAGRKPTAGANPATSPAKDEGGCTGPALERILQRDGSERCS